jgi:defect-in-organelle-trafficking protein DotC
MSSRRWAGFPWLPIASRILVLLVATLLSGCEPAPLAPSGPPTIGGPDRLAAAVPPPTLGEIRVPGFEDQADSDLTKLREDALRGAALSWGAQSGYIRRAWELTRLLEGQSDALDEVYAFDRVAIPLGRQAGYLVPPVVIRTERAFAAEEGGQALSSADEYYEIWAPARLVAVVPTWRDYLLLVAQEPELPAEALRPRDSAERSFFERTMQEGYAQGVAQADLAFEEQVNRLRRDYEGCLEYRRLVALGMMSEVIVAGAEAMASGDADTLRIGDRSVRILDAAAFQTDPTHWKPVVVPAASLQP